MLQRPLIGQIKLTRFHVASLFLPGVRVKRNKKPSLYDVERSGCCAPKRQSIQTCSLDLTRCVLGRFQSSGACPALRRSANGQIRKATAFSWPEPRKWWSLTGSNRRHPACKAGALPAELRPQSFLTEPDMVGPGRLELPTSRLSGVRSNHLSYWPEGGGGAPPTQGPCNEQCSPRGTRDPDRSLKTESHRLTAVYSVLVKPPSFPTSRSFDLRCPP